MYNKRKKVVAVVPTRKGSQRVKNKNTKPFSDTTLLELKLKVLKEVKNIDEIVVNTDCDKSIEIAKKMGVKYHKREEFFASSEVTNDKHWEHLAKTTETDILFIAQTTSPMVKAKTYEMAINKYFENKDILSVNSVTEEKKFLWQDNKALNYDSTKTPKSQDLPDIVSLNFAITIVEKNALLNEKNVVSSKPYFIKLGKVESIDIDDEFDFEFAELFYKKYGIQWLIS